MLVSDFRPTCTCSHSRLYRTLAPRGDRHAATVHDYVSRVRARLNRDNADRCVSVLLQLQALRPSHEAKATQLLRLLLLWRCPLSSRSGGMVLLLTPSGRVVFRPAWCVAELSVPIWTKVPRAPLPQRQCSPTLTHSDARQLWPRHRPGHSPALAADLFGTLFSFGKTKVQSISRQSGVEMIDSTSASIISRQPICSHRLRRNAPIDRREPS